MRLVIDAQCRQQGSTGEDFPNYDLKTNQICKNDSESNANAFGFWASNS
jgi:hypothetical protein